MKSGEKATSRHANNIQMRTIGMLCTMIRRKTAQRFVVVVMMVIVHLLKIRMSLHIYIIRVKKEERVKFLSI